MIMADRNQPGDDGGGFAHGKSYSTIEEAVDAAAKRDDLEAFLLSLSPANRAEWFSTNGDVDGNVAIGELE